LRERPGQSKAGRGRQRPPRGNCWKRILHAWSTAYREPRSNETTVPLHSQKNCARREKQNLTDAFMQHLSRCEFTSLTGPLI
jgi:hypothetical protein